MSCCKVSWCNEETEFYNKTQRHSYCKKHYHYKKYASNAARRPWLMYKVEKILDNQLQCEGCGYDAQTFFPNRPMNELAGLFDVDHIISILNTHLKVNNPQIISYYVNNVIY